MNAVLATPSFEDLVDFADRKRAAARSDAKIAGWNCLLDVLRRLAGRERDQGVLGGRTWWLTEVRAENYQGVVSMPTLTFEQEPGITVLFGANGSGKSSVADAIDTALAGSPREFRRGGGSNRPLWERDHCARDAAQAHVEVVLTSGPEQLVLSVTLDATGFVIHRGAWHRTPSGVVDIDLTTMPWASALAGHRPAFGYAAVERQVQMSRDLQAFLEPLLGLGGCFDELTEEVDAGAREPAAAFHRWSDAVESARRAVSGVDHEHGSGLESRLGDLAWPGIDEDPDDWLAAMGLTEEGDRVAPVSSRHHRRLHDAAVVAESALDGLEEAERSLLARLAGPLRDLDDRARVLDDSGDTCPVCATRGTDWLATLHASVAGLTDVQGRESAFAAAVRALYAALEKELVEVAAVLDQDWFATDIAAQGRVVRERCGDLWRAVRWNGPRATTELRAVLREASATLRSETWAEVVDAAATASDHRRQWLRARRHAVDPLIDVWRVDGELGRDAGTWRQAGECLKSLRSDLRTRRAGDLRERADDTVRRLLRDVGLGVEEFRVQGTTASIGLVDDDGSPVQLSMLSAGQRNALLLAPLLSVAGDGPFGFLVLDDPVHAFDQVRVDHLARVVAELALHRRVIVLTHDERLQEHLLAQSPAYDAREVRRDQATGAVELSPISTAWSTLLDDAETVLTTANDGRARATLPPTDLVRGFCRMAVDNALRGRVLAVARSAGRDVAADLDALDEANTTKNRFDVVRALLPHPEVEHARSLVEPYDRAWNRAMHGNLAESEVTRDEIDMARQACAALVPTS